MKKLYYAGIDYHKNYSTVCVMDADKAVVLEATVKPNSPERFSAVFSELDAPVRCVFECGLNWGYLFDLLESLPMVESIQLANAQRVRIIAEAQIKTDKLDARHLAWLLRADLIPAIHIPPPETRARREVIRQRMYWVKERTRLRNRVHRIIERQLLLKMPKASDLFGKQGMDALRKAVLPPHERLLLDQDLEALKQLDVMVKQLEKEMSTHAKEDEDVRLLSSLTGVGLVIGTMLALEIDGVERFSKPEKLVSYAGLAPSTHSSGGKTRNGRMLPGCNKWLKWAFIEAAWVAVGRSAYLGELYHKQKNRGKKANVAITIVARRMCQIAWHLLKERREFTEEKPTPGCSPCGRTVEPASV